MPESMLAERLTVLTKRVTNFPCERNQTLSMLEIDRDGFGNFLQGNFF